MISSVYNNIAALGAFGKKMGVIGNNVANVYSDGFKKSRAVLTEGAKENSVRADIQQINTPGALISEPTDDGLRQRELSNVDLAEELTETIPTQRGYEANLKIVAQIDDMLGSVIDTLS